MHPNWQDNLHLYCEQNSSPEPSFLKDNTSFAWLRTFNPRQLSGKLQGQLLSMLVSIKNPKTILEIGTFTGYATACLTQNASPNCEIHTIEADAEIAFKTKSFWNNYPFMNKVQFHVGPALEVLPTLNIQPDFIFIDADKLNYMNYFNACLPILRSGGIMLFDNTLWSGKVLDANIRTKDKDTINMHLFNQEIAKCTSWQTVLLPIRDGLTAIVKN